MALEFLKNSKHSDQILVGEANGFRILQEFHTFQLNDSQNSKFS